MNYGSSTSSWKPRRWVRLDLIFCMRDIYINFNLNIQNSPAATEAPSLKISSHGISLKWSRSISISTKIVISYAMKRGVPLWIWWKVNGNWDSNMIRISQWRESHCRTNLSVRRKINRKYQDYENHSLDPSKKVNHLGKVISDRKMITKFTRSISSTRVRKSMLIMYVKVSKCKNISRWVDRENLIYVRLNRIKICAQLIEEKKDTEWSKASRKHN